MNKFWIFILLFAGGFTPAQAQFCNESLLFSWEGALTGNKAVWGVGDSSNIYKIGNVDVTVTLQDSFEVNTDLDNPSEFDDYTKSNAFYGPGSLMLQATSTTADQPLCLHFSFSSPVIIQDFKIYDIDYLAGNRPESSFQDSLSFYADMNGRNVPVTLEYLSMFPQYTISGQSLYSNYLLNTNGNLNHTDVRGAVKVHTDQVAINSFTLCYANGSLDDGLSNSHAIRVMGFDFCSVGTGTIGGMVKEEGTGNPLSGSTLQLFDTLGLPVLNSIGNLYTTITGPDGLYYFENLPMGIYDIVQTTDPPGYHSVSDGDGNNDNSIRVVIDTNISISLGNDFIEGLGVLPVEFGGMFLSWKNQELVLVEWLTLSEINNDYFTLYYSYDGNIYERLAKITGKGNTSAETRYSIHHEPIEGQNFIYYKLIQTDMDGRFSELSLSNIKRQNKDVRFSLYPNPSNDFIKLTGTTYQKDIYYTILDASGNPYVRGRVEQNFISIRDLRAGQYYIQVVTGGQTTTLPFQKL